MAGSKIIFDVLPPVSLIPLPVPPPGFCASLSFASFSHFFRSKGLAPLLSLLASSYAFLASAHWSLIVCF
ncbi:MAG: hypothetical protein QM820_54025 [Minicystis sp.]